MLRVRFVPTEFTESTEFVSVGMAGMPYPPTSVRICAICGRLFSARGSVCSVHSVGASSPLVRLVQLRQLHPLGWQRGYGRDAIPSYICAHPCHLWESFLCKRFCVFGAFRGSFFTACSVGAAETAAPPGVIHGSSAHISPPHHLTISPQQHHFTSNPAFCMSSQYCGYDFVTTCGSLMRSPGNTIAAGANAIAMRWSS